MFRIDIKKARGHATSLSNTADIRTPQVHAKMSCYFASRIPAGPQAY